MTRFESTYHISGCTVPADMVDVNRDMEESGENEGKANKLASSF